MRKKKSWLIVENKATYLLLLSIPIGIAKIVLYDLKGTNVLVDIMCSLFIAFAGVYFFIRDNTYSHWHNPDHPRPDDFDKKE